MNSQRSQPESTRARGASVDASALSSIARRLYVDGPLLTRKLQHWRPYICPFDKVIDEIPPKSFVLDIGCGGGLLLGALADLGRIDGGVGFDYSPRAIKVANAMAATLRREHHLVFHDLSVDADWPSGPFNAVTMIDVLHHVPPPLQQDVFRRAARMIRPGARLIYKDIASRPRWRAFANTMHDLILARQIVHYVPLRKIVAWAEAEGLTLLREFRYHRLWYGHQFAVFERSQLKS